MAKGATIQAAIVHEAEGKVQNLLLHGIALFSLRIETRMKGDGLTIMKVLIEKRTIRFLLLEKTIFSTSGDDQSVVVIQVYQGESSEPTKNQLLGSFVLDDSLASPTGDPKIAVIFHVKSISGSLSLHHPA